jgi:HEAT repeat protein
MAALVRMDASAPVAKLLKDSDVRLRAQAANALGLASQNDRTAGGALIGSLNDRDPGVVAACIIALLQIDYPAAVPALNKVGDDPKQNEAVKIAAKEAALRIQNNEKARIDRDKK